MWLEEEDLVVGVVFGAWLIDYLVIRGLVSGGSCSWGMNNI